MNIRFLRFAVLAVLGTLVWVTVAAAYGERATVPTDQEMDEIEAEMEGGRNQAIEDGVSKGTELGLKIVDIYDSWEDFSAAHDALTPDDRQFDPDYSPPGSPEIPSACAESEECNECYEKAVHDINFYRFSLDKGHSLAHATIQYSNKAIAFGDTTAGSFGVGGMAWSLDAKPKIEKSVDKLRHTYNSKYSEWISGLETALKALGACEEEHFGDRDWYGRFGYIYYSFMADRYKSPD